MSGLTCCKPHPSLQARGPTTASIPCTTARTQRPLSSGKCRSFKHVAAEAMTQTRVFLAHTDFAGSMLVYRSRGSVLEMECKCIHVYMPIHTLKGHRRCMSRMSGHPEDERGSELLPESLVPPFNEEPM